MKAIFAVTQLIRQDPSPGEVMNELLYGVIPSGYNNGLKTLGYSLREPPSFKGFFERVPEERSLLSVNEYFCDFKVTQKLGVFRSTLLTKFRLQKVIILIMSKS